MKSLSNVVSFLLCILCASLSMAVPIQLSHQGRLLDASSNPLTGNYSFTVRIYTNDIGGNLLWEESQSVDVEVGLYSIILGKTTPLDFSEFGIRPDSCWLEIQIGADAPLTPRTKLTSVPVAAVATSLQGDVSIVNQSMYFIDTTGDTTITLKSSDDGVIQTTTWTQTSGPFKFSSRTGTTVGGYTGLSNSDSPREISASLTDSFTGIVIIDSTGDTTYQLVDRAEVKVEKIQFRQQFGPTQKTSQGTNDTSAYIDVTSGNGNDSSHAIVQAIESRSVLKTYFETGDIPTQSSITSSMDSTILEMTYDTIADASLRVSDGGTSFILAEGRNTPDGARGYEFSVHPDRMELKRGIREGGHTIGAGQVMSLSASNITMTDSLGDTTFHFEDTENSSYRVYNKRKFSEQQLADANRAISSIIYKESPDSTIQKKIEHGTTADGAYLVLLDSLNDTTIVIEGSGGSLQGGRVVVAGADAGMGIPPGVVEIADLDADGLTDITCDGNIGIGVQVPTNVLEVAQNSSTDPIADAWTTYSSRRWKENITPIQHALEKVQKLRGVEYDWKASGKHDIGLIAEEVGEVIPEVVVFEKNGIDAQSVDYPRLVALLIQASKEQQTEMEMMKKEIDDLKALVLKLADNSIKNTNSLYGQR